MAKQDQKPAPLSAHEVAARLMGVFERYDKPNEFKPGDIIKISPGIDPTQAVGLASRNPRFLIVLEVAASFRAALNAPTQTDNQAAFCAYLDDDCDVQLGWITSWKYQLVEPGDYRAATLNG